MSEENKIRDALEAAKGLVEAIPVYQDVVQPAAKEVGVALQTVAKTIHVVLAPVSGLVWGYEKIKDFVVASLAEKLQKVPKDRLVTPSPTVAGPVLEALRYSGHDSTLRELYANLLATAMDSKTAKEAHPAFVEIIKQLTPDEARIVGLFSKQETFPVITVRAYYKDQAGGIDVFRHFSLIGQEAGCVYLDQAPIYLDNLCRLGLAEIPEDYILSTPGLYEALETHPQVVAVVNEVKKSARADSKIKKKALLVTNLGEQFCSACVANTDRG